MLKVLASLVAVSLCACYTTTQNKSVTEPADPTVGDLRCARPRISILEALYERPADHLADVDTGGCPLGTPMFNMTIVR